MARHNRECALCGKSYKYCSSCSQDRMKPSWMAEFHEENCKNIFDICTKFNLGMITKKEAQQALSVCNLSDKANFKPYVQQDLMNIFAEDPKPAVKPVARPKTYGVVTESNE